MEIDDGSPWGCRIQRFRKNLLSVLEVKGFETGLVFLVTIDAPEIACGIGSNIDAPVFYLFV